MTAYQTGRKTNSFFVTLTIHHHFCRFYELIIKVVETIKYRGVFDFKLNSLPNF